VTVTNLLKYADRQAAVMTDTTPPQILTISEILGSNSSSSSTVVVLLKGTLSRPVHLAEDDDTVDWSIETITTRCNSSSSMEKKYIHIVLYKATPFPGMALWWKQCFLEETHEIEIDWVDPKTKSAFQKAWDEAHEQFRAASGVGNHPRKPDSV
jgi:hypothetical protein